MTERVVTCTRCEGEGMSFTPSGWPLLCEQCYGSPEEHAARRVAEQQEGWE